MGEFFLGWAWLQVVSDAFIAAAFFSIAFTLFYFLRQRRDLKLRGLVVMFSGFILACGTTHLLSAWNVWHSAYRLEELIKAITAILSVATAVAAIRLRPTILKIASSRQLEEINQKLKEIEDGVNPFFEAAPHGILGIASDGRISMVNRRIEELFGYSRAELIGQELELLLPARFRAIHVSHRTGYFAEPRMRAMAAGMDLAGLRKDGTEFPIEIGLSHANTAAGPVVFGMVSDISERIKAADDVKRVNEELRRSNVEIEQFAHVASHDLQEPLRMVTSYLQLIERRYPDRLDSTGKEFIAFAVDGAKRMKNLIRDLLEFSRAGTHSTRFREVDTGAILDHALDNLKIAIEETSAVITADSLPTLCGDPVLLTQVFQNLIANAIKFQKGTEPCVHVSAREQGAEWIFSVRDNGIGIESRHLDRIFHIFERLHSVEEYSGSGIGLAITRKIVERHRGKIWVESQPGAGSTFFFSLSSEMGLVEEESKRSLSATR